MTDPSPSVFTLHHGDARQMSRVLDSLAKPNEPPLACTITSPPYGGMKNYGHPDQIGWGQPHDEYLAEMRSVFRRLYQYTRQDGSLWLIADTMRADDRVSAGVPQRMEPLPFQLAEQASDAGWILRETIIWNKQKTLPWSSGKRLRNVFEYVLLLVKSSSYKFYQDRLRDAENLEEWWVKWPERYNPSGKVPTNIWSIPIPQQGRWAGTTMKHVCPLPADLVERLIFLSTDPGDVVFDPFAGTGVVVAEAERLGRRGLGIELNSEYAEYYPSVTIPEIARRNEKDPVRDRMARAEELRNTIIRLRALKYSKVLWQRLSADATMALPQYVVTLAGKINSRTMIDSATPLQLKILFAYDESADADLTAVQLRLKEIASRPPVTKFGITAEVAAVPESQVSMHLGRQKLFLYEHGHTWNSVGRIKLTELKTLRAPGKTRAHSYNYPPMVGNVEVHETPGRRGEAGAEVITEDD